MRTYSAVRSVVRNRTRLRPRRSFTRISQLGWSQFLMGAGLVKADVLCRRRNTGLACQWRSQVDPEESARHKSPPPPGYGPSLDRLHAHAVLTSGERKQSPWLLAALLGRLLACSTNKRMTCCTPSPSATICSAKGLADLKQSSGKLLSHAGLMERNRALFRWPAAVRCHSSRCLRRPKCN